VAVLEYTGGDLEQSRSMLEDQYHGLHDSEKDFTESSFAETREIPEYLVNYIDYEAMARDWFMSDFISLEVNHQVAVFSTC
jgi:antirestriction protein